MYTETLAYLVLVGLGLFGFFGLSYFLVGVWYESRRK